MATYSYDISTDVGKVRALVPDRSEGDYLLSDEEIAFYLAIEPSLKRAAAQAIEVIASDQVLVLKAIKILQLQTDGPKMSVALLQRAQRLRDSDDYAQAAAGLMFDIAEWVTTSFSYDEILDKEYWRTYG